MLWDYIEKNFKKGEPILLAELPAKTKRSELDVLIKQGRLKRYGNGIYYKPYKTPLGFDGSLNPYDILKKKYLVKDGKTIGYFTGIDVANSYGFTTQVPSYIELCTNSATTQTRRSTANNLKTIVYRPVAEVNEKNAVALQFLDLMRDMNIYCELNENDRNKAIKRYIELKKPDFDEVKKYLPLYPSRTYRNLYEGDVMNELV